MGEILGREELKARLDAERRAGKKIVFTNGCFDIIHSGHVRYLKEAKKLGNVLVLGLNSDASVSRLKPGRPINKISERAEVAAALLMIDYVTVFEEDTPYNLIKFLRPDVLVKGGDWKKEDIVGSDLVPETRSLGFHEGFSTTGIIGKIEKKKKKEKA